MLITSGKIVVEINKRASQCDLREKNNHYRGTKATAIVR